jgi:hypothetical protein
MLLTNIRQLDSRVTRMLTAAIEYHATRGEATMRRSAKWKDRTTNARNGLHTSTQHSSTKHSIIFAHGVSYGIWLEVRWAGRYAVIQPSMTKTGAELMTTIGGALGRIS